MCIRDSQVTLKGPSRDLQGRTRDSQGASRDPQGSPRTIQGPPRDAPGDLQGRPRDVLFARATGMFYEQGRSRDPQRSLPGTLRDHQRLSRHPPGSHQGSPRSSETSKPFQFSSVVQSRFFKKHAFRCSRSTVARPWTVQGLLGIPRELQETLKGPPETP